MCVRKQRCSVSFYWMYGMPQVACVYAVRAGLPPSQMKTSWTRTLPHVCERCESNHAMQYTRDSSHKNNNNNKCSKKKKRENNNIFVCGIKCIADRTIKQYIRNNRMRARDAVTPTAYVLCCRCVRLAVVPYCRISPLSVWERMYTYIFLLLL